MRGWESRGHCTVRILGTVLPGPAGAKLLPHREHRSSQSWPSREGQRREGAGGSSHCNPSLAGERSALAELAGIRATGLDCPAPALHPPRTRVQIPVLRGSCPVLPGCCLESGVGRMGGPSLATVGSSSVPLFCEAQSTSSNASA